MQSAKMRSADRLRLTLGAVESECGSVAEWCLHDGCAGDHDTIAIAARFGRVHLLGRFSDVFAKYGKLRTVGKRPCSSGMEDHEKTEDLSGKGVKAVAAGKRHIELEKGGRLDGATPKVSTYIARGGYLRFFNWQT